MKKTLAKQNRLSFKPSFWLKNRHMQTLYSTFFSKEPKIELNNEVFHLNDGDFLDISYNPQLLPKDAKAICVLFHGLAGSADSPYIQRAIKALQNVGIAAVVMHYRSSSGRDNIQPFTYHSGKSDDALAFLTSLKQRYSEKKLFCVGYSLGGNMLLKLLGELKEKSFIDAAIAVSAPMDLAVCADVINSGFSRIYQEHLLKDLRKTLLQKYEKHDMQKLIGLKKEDVKRLKSFWEFDDAYTAKINGFETAQNYYRRNSAKPFLKKITTPTLIIHALDDPFMSPAVIPKESEISKSITLEVLAHGGHVGFISGSFKKPRYWLEKRIVLFLTERLNIT